MFGRRRGATTPPADTRPEALAIKREEATRQLLQLQTRRSEFQTRTGRIFVFLAALIAFAGAQIGRAGTPLEQAMLGAAALASIVPLVLISRASTRDLPVDRVDLEKISEGSAVEANRTLLEETRRAMGELATGNRRRRAYLLAAEQISAVIAVYIIGLSLDLLIVEKPDVTSARAYVAFALAAIGVVLIVLFCVSARRAVRRGPRT
jgi:hypothetical protein